MTRTLGAVVTLSYTKWILDNHPLAMCTSQSVSFKHLTFAAELRDITNLPCNIFRKSRRSTVVNHQISHLSTHDNRSVLKCHLAAAPILPKRCASILVI